MDSGFSGLYEGKCRDDTDYPLTRREVDGYPFFSGLDEPVDIILRGLPASLTLSGTASDFERLGLFSYWTVTGADATPPMVDVAVTDTFSATLSQPPPDDAWIWTKTEWRYALAIPKPYADLDGSGDYSDGDPLDETTTGLDESDAVARYTNPITLWQSWRLMECCDAYAGWRLVTYSADLGWVDFHTEGEASALHLEDGECSL
ncbi:MAG: hypothetical protein ACI8RZ_000308 [Myxococcota bacterium]